MRPTTLWRPARSGTGHALLAVREGEARALIIEAPHPFFDTGTLEESTVIFARVRARALLASGTHPCALARPSGCDGTTDACAPDESVRESDMAHSTNTLFQAACRALAALAPTALVLSMHGMVDPGVSLSDGTTADTHANATIAHFAAALSPPRGGLKKDGRRFHVEGTAAFDCQAPSVRRRGRRTTATSTAVPMVGRAVPEPEGYPGSPPERMRRRLLRPGNGLSRQSRCQVPSPGRLAPRTTARHRNSPPSRETWRSRGGPRRTQMPIPWQEGWRSRSW